MEARTHSSTLEESTIVERVARIVSTVRGTKPDYTRLAVELEQAIPFDIFGVVLLRHDRQAVRVIVCHREGNSWVAVHHQHPFEDSRLAQVLEAPNLVANEYPRGLDGPPASSGDALSGYHQLRSTLITPLVVEEHVLGTLELGSTVPHIYADQSLRRLINAVARVLATAIESAQLGGNAAIQDRQRQALKDVTTALTSETDLSTILDQIVSGIARALNVAALIIMFDRREGKLCLEAYSGLDATALHTAFLRNLDVHSACIIGQTLQRRQPHVSHDIGKDERFPKSGFLFTELGLRSVFCYPLVTDTTVYGALLLCSPEAGGFSPLKADIFSLFANQATVAIHNGMLLEAVHQRSRFQKAVEQLEQTQKRVTTGSLDHDEANTSLREELVLFKQVRAEAQRTFGVSFSSMLHFISENLLTQEERGLQSIFSPDQAKQPLELRDLSYQAVKNVLPDERETVPAKSAVPREGKDPFADTLSLLSQTAEAALARAGMLGELGRLMTQLRQSTTGVKDGWFVVDIHGFCTYMNPAAEVFCGIRLEDLSASYGSQLLAASPAQNHQSSMAIEEVFAKLLLHIRNAEEVHHYLENFSQESIYRHELRCTLAAERVDTPVAVQTELDRPSEYYHHTLQAASISTDYHYHFTRYPLYNQQGQLVANALQVHDVTEQVRDEKNRSALLSSVSHDLRTPLTTIKAAVTGLLQMDVAWDEEDKRAMLEDIDAEADHLTVLVNAIVELSRIEMGALVLEKEWCDVVEVVYGALARLERPLTGHRVRTQFQPRLPLIFVDHAQIERVFYNLIENAIRRSPVDAEIVVILDTIGEAPEMVRAQVIDYGEKIPAHERERLFKSFHRPPSYGNGLSLAICKGIIEAHQGRIKVESAIDAGSCFVFALPTHPHTVMQAEGEALSATNWDHMERRYDGQRKEDERSEDLEMRHAFSQQNREVMQEKQP